MQWANSSNVEQGEVKRLFDNNSKKWCLIIADENSDGGYYVLGTGTYEEVRAEYDRYIEEDANAFSEDIEAYKSFQGKYNSSMREHSEQRNGRQYSLGNRESGPKFAGTANAQYVRTNNQEKSSEAGLDNSAFSMPENDIRYSFEDNERYAEYDKPITPGDIRLLRKIGRKSINEFTTEEIEIAQKWAYKFYQQLGTKSPFFRRWFGDWRAYDKSDAKIVSFAYGENDEINYSKRTIHSEEELNAEILVDETIINDSLSYAKKNRDEKQIRKLLGKIDEILSNGILLDTQISTHSSGNKKGSTQFMHYLYAPISVNDAPFIAKLSIEEYDLTGKNRAYNLQRIKLSEVSRAQYSQLIEENRGKFAYTSDALSVAQLFNLVKTYDTKFKPNPVNEALINKADDTPTVTKSPVSTILQRAQCSK